MASTIPIELQEQILDCLLGDISSLKSCSRVCRAWGPATRIHLYRKFTAVYDASTEQDDPAFYHCGMYVEEVLHLAPYIREIDIQDGPGVFLEDGVASELHALCNILDHTGSLRRISVSTFRGVFMTMRSWKENSVKFRASLSAALRRSCSSLTHLFVYGYSLALSDVEMFRGMQRLEYVGLERIGVESDENETPLVQISHDESHQGRIQTLTLYFNYSDPANGHLITSLINALHAVNILAITNLRLGGVVNASVLEALPPQWLSSVTRLGLELTNLNPTHSSSPLSAALIAKVPTFRAVRALELSLNIYPSADPHDLSALEVFMDKLLPPHRIDSIITTVAAYGPPVYIDALLRHYDFCLLRADVVKVQWEDGRLEYLEGPFSQFFANGTMQIGKFRRDKWISW
ncbi:hypothetical protein DFH08DRAFT_515900 [Mycena albidolilacea]|uniref:F-box domain-containing protein n=1 Tax=Mycena albidolilacea TaxID=1033008 RepID=A0AAD6Z3X6_9AGAR|nr:hypothetical protein DFH08DRAFT_515900 [Mycena albidolilacea]